MANEYKVPLTYVIIAVLVTVVICLVSFKWYDIPNLASLITFALTVTSLVISVLAIGYAVVSNLSFSQNISNLNNASDEISTTAKDVSEAAKELKGKIEAIPTKLESMEGKFDQLMSFKQTSEPQDTTPLSKTENEATSEIVDLFVKKISLFGWIGSYIFFLSFKKKKAFNLSESFKFTDGDLAKTYIFAICTAMASVGLVSLKYQGDFVSITSFNEKLATALGDNFNEFLNGKIERLKMDDAKKQQRKIDIENDVASIHQYFDE